LDRGLGHEDLREFPMSIGQIIKKLGLIAISAAKGRTVGPCVLGTSIWNSHTPPLLISSVDIMDNAEAPVGSSKRAAHKVTIGKIGRLKAEEQRNSIDRPETLLS
jgi:hypothetical protein